MLVGQFRLNYKLLDGLREIMYRFHGAQRVNPLVPPAGQNISTSARWIGTKFGSDVLAPLWMNCNSCGDPLNCTGQLW